jgi:hypothetical protein
MYVTFYFLIIRQSVSLQYLRLTKRTSAQAENDKNGAFRVGRTVHAE